MIDYIELDGPQSYKTACGRTILCKGGGGSSTTVQNIPTELKPLATRYSDMAIGLSNDGFSPYEGQRFENLNNTQMNGIQGIISRAKGGSQTMDMAQSELQGMMGGGSNPYLDSMVQRAQDSVKSNFNTGAVNSGSFGNSGLQEQFARTLGDTANQMYGQAYDGDRARQLQAIGMAPQFAQADYADADRMLGAGQILQDQNQQQKDFDYSQYQAEEDHPYKQLAAMAGVFGSNLGGSSTTKQSGGGK